MIRQKNTSQNQQPTNTMTSYEGGGIRIVDAEDVHSEAEQLYWSDDDTDTIDIPKELTPKPMEEMPRSLRLYKKFKNRH